MSHNFKNKIRLILNNFSRRYVKFLAAFSTTRRLLNKKYLKLSPADKAHFHSMYAKIFRQNTFPVHNGVWDVTFLSQKIHMPLSPNEMWLDWDCAVSIVGHDIEIKQTYDAILRSHSIRPGLFIDIGANYGMHSLLFLVNNIQTITFEPNKNCHNYFLNVCAINNVIPTLEKVALGAEDGFVELQYPARDTWLGSINNSIIDKLSHSYKLNSQIAEQKKLDDYLGLFNQPKVLIKIDTEGYEFDILKGAIHTIDKIKPMIIFESIYDNDRTYIYNYFKNLMYNIYYLPWTPNNVHKPLSLTDFINNKSSNYIALSK